MALLGCRTEVSLRRILFATDFSLCSDTALVHALAFSRWFDSTLYTVTTVPPELADPYVSPDPFYLQHSAEVKMEGLLKSGLFQGIQHHELIEEEGGPVAEVLLELTNKLDIHLIVLGTHGRGGIKKLALGSVAETIVNCAPCAVLTVGPHVTPKPLSELKLQRILYATDLLPGSARALEHALWSHCPSALSLDLEDSPPGGTLRGTRPRGQQEVPGKSHRENDPPTSEARIPR
jgi:universal stress protein A